jgi:AhpD family alkylhydroperoxidase
MAQSMTSWFEIDSALSDIRKTFGFLPAFVENLPSEGLPGAWSTAKRFFFAENTALDTKTKDLLGLAVSVQIPCDYTEYFDENASRTNGATRPEQAEAVVLSAMVRHWSTVLNGSLMEKDAFRNETDQIMSFVKDMLSQPRDKLPRQEFFLVQHLTVSDAYKDIEKTLGMVPKFFLMLPEEALPGAWSEFKAVQLSPYTALSSKHKELIGLAVAAQIPCEYCIYYHREGARLSGASEREIQEAVGVAAVTRHWSAILNAFRLDRAAFRKDADRMIENVSNQDLQA